VAHLQAASIDDCLELFDLLMVNELLAKAEREANKQRAREHPRLAGASVKLAPACGCCLRPPAPETPRTSARCGIRSSRWPPQKLHTAVNTVDELVPFVDEDDEGKVRERLSERIRLVSAFLREPCEVIEFGSNTEAEPVLREMRRMPELLHPCRKLTARTSTSDSCGGRGGGLFTASLQRAAARRIATGTCSAC
jgi:hypothetical protein